MKIIKKMFSKAKKEKLSMTELASRVGVLPQYISALKANPARQLQDKTADRIQKFLNSEIHARPEIKKAVKISGLTFKIESNIPIPGRQSPCTSAAVITFTSMNVGDSFAVSETKKHSAVGAIQHYLKRNNITNLRVAERFVNEGPEKEYRIWKESK